MERVSVASELTQIWDSILNLFKFFLKIQSKTLVIFYSWHEYLCAVIVSDCQNNILWSLSHSQKQLSHAELLIGFWLWEIVSYTFQYYCIIFCVATCPFHLAPNMKLADASWPIGFHYIWHQNHNRDCYCNLGLASKFTCMHWYYVGLNKNVSVASLFKYNNLKKKCTSRQNIYIFDPLHMTL